MKYSLRVVVAAILSAQFAAGVTVVNEDTFTTTTEGWTQNGDFTTFKQATASTGEGVLQVRNGTAGSANDPKLFVNPGTLSLPTGQSWDAIEFRMRQLVDDGGSPGAPQSFVVSGTLLSATVVGEGFQSFQGIGSGNAATAPFWSQVAEADGWYTFTFDLGGYMDANSIDKTTAQISDSRFDPIGNASGLGKWVEVDYLQFTSVPEPGSSVLLLGALGLLALRRRR